MAAGTDSAAPPPSSAGSDHEEGELVDDSAGSDLELEEGEFVPGPDDDIRHEGDGLPETKRRRIEFEGVVVDGGPLPSPTPTPSCDRDSDGTISDAVDADAGAASRAQGLLFPCPVCGREFTSQNAVNAHMGIHRPRGSRQGNTERLPVTPAVSGGWAVTGNVGRRSVSPRSEGVADSMATVVSEPVFDPMPIAFAFPSRSSGAEPNPPPNDDSMDIIGESSGNPTNQVVVHPPCSPQFLQSHQPAAPQPLVAQAQPTVAQAQQLAEEAARQFVVHQPAAQHVQRTSPPPPPPPPPPQDLVVQAQPTVSQGQQRAEDAARQFVVNQPAAHHVQRTSPSPPPPARDEQGWWLCNEEGCDYRCATPQGIDVHLLGHKNRQINEAAAAGSQPARSHLYNLCPSAFTSGLQLVTPKKPGAVPKMSAAEPGSALALSPPMPPAAMEAAPAEPAVAPSTPGVLRLFGVNIVAAPPPGAAANGTSSAVTETDQSSAASTNTEQ